jgi:hypothetical protein
MVYLPPGFMPMRRIFSSGCCAPSSGAGPSGSSPVPVLLARRRSSVLDGGEGSQGPDCFLSFCPEDLVVISGVVSAVPGLAGLPCNFFIHRLYMRQHPGPSGPVPVQKKMYRWRRTVLSGVLLAGQSGEHLDVSSCAGCLALTAGLSCE